MMNSLKSAIVSLIVSLTAPADVGFKCPDRVIVVGTTIATVTAMWRLLDSYLTEENLWIVAKI